MSDFRCPRYYWDGTHWRCQNLPNDYLDVHDFDTYCTSKTRCLECPYMDSAVREEIADFKREQEERLNDLKDEYKSYQEESGSSSSSYSSSSSGSSSSSYSSSSSSSSSDGSSLFDIFRAILSLIMLILAPIFKYVVIPLFKYYIFPMMVSCYNIITIPMLILGGLVTPFFFFVNAVLVMASFPYWIRLFIHKVKNDLSYSDILPYFKKWFLKGPWAYRDLNEFIKK